MQPDILKYFPPGLTPRPAQAALLLAIQDAWCDADVLVLLCPPASGKTEIAYTIAHWQAAQRQTTNYLPPENVLVLQTQERYPKLTTLLRKNMYSCECHLTEESQEGCATAQYMHAKEAAKRARVRLMNTHVYRAHRLYAPVAIFDEAHKLYELLDDVWPVRFWAHDYKFPKDLRSVADVVAWGQAHLAQDPSDDRLRKQLLEIGRIRLTSTIEYRTLPYRGKAAELLEVRPAPEKVAAQRLWPDQVRKIVLMSATIGPKDVEELGLANRRVVYLNCDSPIPAPQRPVAFKRVCNMGQRYIEHALPMLAREVLGLLEREPGKGLVHVPYSLVPRLQQLMQHPRLRWHNKRDKQEALSRFREEPPESGAVLVCSGLYEGVDLPFDDDSWQVIGKVPYPSLGDEEVKRRMAADPDWYDWQAIKKLLQAYGRLPRRVDGHGTTYIFDLNYERLLKTDRKRATRMLPAHFIAAQRGVV